MEFQRGKVGDSEKNQARIVLGYFGFVCRVKWHNALIKRQHIYVTKHTIALQEIVGIL